MAIAPARETATLAFLRRFLLAALAVGVAGTAGELILLGHFESAAQWIPVAALGLAAVVLVWHASSPSRLTVRLVQVLMAAFIVSGLVGVGLHYDGNVEFEREWSAFNFEHSKAELNRELFARFEAESIRLLDLGLALPGYDYCIKCSHLFNLLDARGAVSQAERVAYIGRVRKLARRAARAFLEQRRELGFPLLPPAAAAKETAPPAVEEAAQGVS